MFLPGVVEAHITEFHLSLDFANGLSIGGILNFRRSVHDFTEPLHTGHATLELLGKLHQPADGRQ